MSFFGFPAKGPAPVTPPSPPNLIHALIRKRSLYPVLPAGPGESKTLARQLDITLMRSGFKLSAALLVHLGRCDFTAATTAAQDILSTARELVGDHVKHNPYFARFPRDVPDTLEFWIRCLFEHYLTGEPVYGQHLHTFEEMVERHARFRPKGDARLKTIDLGAPLEAELRTLFAGLAGATIPLNLEDRTLLAALFDQGFTSAVAIPIRENKAILNSLRLRKDQPMEVDTVVDVLRIACALSEGDVTLATPTKFKSFSRRHRRSLVEALDALIARDARKLDDASNYKERFKRLAEKLHPREYPRCTHAVRLFDFTGGSIAVETFGRRTHEVVAQGRHTGNFQPAIDLLAERPGMLLKHIDLILRSGDERSSEELISALRPRIDKISGRNLLNLDQHLANRTGASRHRIFVNRLGGGFAKEEALPPLADHAIAPLRACIRAEIVRRIPSMDTLVVDWSSLQGISVPISEKSKSDGFAVLPRGSTFPVTADSAGSLRFFMYWKQRKLRTDYDLSCAFYNANFELVTQVSWTNLRGGDGEKDTIVHSGDFTDAPAGASEFIDIRLWQLDPQIAYILPSMNFFSGEIFADAEAAFFGFMERPDKSRGLPFEAATVSTKFALKGNGRVCVPMIFVRHPDRSVTGKWLDIYSRGLSWANRVEHHKFTTLGLAKAIWEKSFTPLTQLVELYCNKAKLVLPLTAQPTTPVTYIGLRRPEGLHPESRCVTLESFRTLIPP